MTIDDKIEAVKEFHHFAAKYQQLQGTEATVIDWRESLERGALRRALENVAEIAEGMLSDDFLRTSAQQILLELEGI